MVRETSAILTLYFAKQGWFKGQYDMLPNDEARERWMRKKGKDERVSDKYMLAMLYDF